MTPNIGNPLSCFFFWGGGGGSTVFWEGGEVLYFGGVRRGVFFWAGGAPHYLIFGGGGCPINYLIMGGGGSPVHAALGAELGLIVAMLAMAAHQLVGVGAVGGVLRHQRDPNAARTPVMVYL